MKTILMLALMISASSFAAKETTRKISNSSYYVCRLERDNVDKKVFKKDFHFPFPVEKDESYQLKGSMRWNNYKVIFFQTGEVAIAITENVGGQILKVTKTHQLGKDPQFESFRVQVDLKKDDIIIPYHLSCSPE